MGADGRRQGRRGGGGGRGGGADHAAPVAHERGAPGTAAAPAAAAADDDDASDSDPVARLGARDPFEALMASLRADGDMAAGTSSDDLPTKDPKATATATKTATSPADGRYGRHGR